MSWEMHGSLGWPLGAIVVKNTVLQFSTVNPFRKCFIFNWCYFEDSYEHIFNPCHCPMWNLSPSMNSAFTYSSSRSCMKVCICSSSSRPISKRAQRLTCIKPVLEQRPCKTPMKTTKTGLFYFIHLSSLLNPKQLHRIKITKYTHDLLV